jgi:hypothetical protein
MQGNVMEKGEIYGKREKKMGKRKREKGKGKEGKKEKGKGKGKREREKGNRVLNGYNLSLKPWTWAMHNELTSMKWIRKAYRFFLLSKMFPTGFV